MNYCVSFNWQFLAAAYILQSSPPIGWRIFYNPALLLAGDFYHPALLLAGVLCTIQPSYWLAFFTIQTSYWLEYPNNVCLRACAVDLSTPSRPNLYLLSCLAWLGALALVSVASTLILAILVYVDTVRYEDSFQCRLWFLEIFVTAWMMDDGLFFLVVGWFHRMALVWCLPAGPPTTPIPADYHIPGFLLSY